MICYQDEKIYGTPITDKSAEELDAEIRELEMELYGAPLERMTKQHKKPMIFDVTQMKLVEVQE